MVEETKVNENVNFDGAYGYWRLREDGVLEWITADPHVQLTDLLFAPGFIKIDNVSGKVVDNGLSPNPDGSGYVKQVNATSLNAINPEENVLYVVGDRKFKYLKTDIVDPGTNKIIIPHGFNRVFAIPSVAQVKGVHGTPRKENVTPKEIPQVFPHPVAFLKEVYVKGKKLEDYIDAQGGVTEEELQAALAAYLKKTDGAVIWNDIIHVGVNNCYMPFDMKAGDIALYSGMFYLITAVTKSSNAVTAATFYPLNTSFGTITIRRYNNGTWSSVETLIAGTKLYKHVARLQNNWSGDVFTIEMVIISTDSQSLAGKDTQLKVNGFVSATWRNLDESESGELPALGQNGWGVWIIVDANDSLSTLDNEGNYLTDTVTQL